MVVLTCQNGKWNLTGLFPEVVHTGAARAGWAFLIGALIMPMEYRRKQLFDWTLPVVM